MLRAARGLALAGGLTIAGLGALGGVLGIVVSFVSPLEARLSLLLMAASVALLSVPLGCALAWQAWQSIAGRPSSLWYPERVGIWLLLFVAALVVGQFSASRPPLDLVVLPVAHACATALPPLIVLILVGRSLDGAARRRDLVLQLGFGAFLSTAAAMLGEVVIVLLLAAAAVVALGVLPGGQDWLLALAERIADPALQADPSKLSELLGAPWIWAAALVAASGIAPLVEESLKSAGVGLLLYRRPHREEAYLWGLASGAGFAAVESALNSVLGLADWGTAVLMRVPAGVMHCFTGALMGLAWHAAALERRWKRATGLFAASLTLHGVWNALAVTSGLSAFGRSPGPLEPTGWADAAAVGSTLGLLALGVGVAVGLRALTRRLGASRDLSASDGLDVRPDSPLAGAVDRAETEARATESSPSGLADRRDR